MIDNSIKYKPAGNSRQQQFMLRLWSNLLVHLGINKKMKIFGGGGIIRQLLRLTTVSLAGCLHSSSSICTTSPEHLLVVVVATITYYYCYLASSQSVDIIITGATTLNQHASKKTRNKRRRRAWQIKVTNLLVCIPADANLENRTCVLLVQVPFQSMCTKNWLYKYLDFSYLPK